MKTNIKYDNGRPIMRLEKGDKAIISVTHFPFAKEKDKNKYGDIPRGKYNAICIEPYYLQCEEQPLLSGRYNYWRGEKWGCSDGIYADEAGDKKDN